MSVFKFALCLATLVCGMTAGAQIFGEDHHIELTTDLGGVTTTPLMAVLAGTERTAIRLEGGGRYLYKGQYGIGVHYGVEEKHYEVIRRNTYDAAFESQGYRIEALVLSERYNSLQAGLSASYLFGSMESKGQVRTEPGYFNGFTQDFSQVQRYSGVRLEFLMRLWLTEAFAFELGTGFSTVHFDESDPLYPAYLVPMSSRSFLNRDYAATALTLRLGLTVRF